MIRRFAARAPAANVTSHFGTARFFKSEKIVTGSVSAFLTSTTVVGAFHLIVVPVPLSVAGATIAAATCSGAMCVFEGTDDQGGTSFGAVCGIFLGAIGGYYAKSASEPWRK